MLLRAFGTGFGVLLTGITIVGLIGSKMLELEDMKKQKEVEKDKPVITPPTPPAEIQVKKTLYQKVETGCKHLEKTTKVVAAAGVGAGFVGSGYNSSLGTNEFKEQPNNHPGHKVATLGFKTSMDGWRPRHLTIINTSICLSELFDKVKDKIPTKTNVDNVDKKVYKLH